MSILLRMKLTKRSLKPAWLIWLFSGCKSPSPQKIKMRVLKRHSVSGLPWVETGTYLGDTTRYLSSLTDKVVSIEPELSLFKFATKRLKKFKNVEIRNGSSEEIFERICNEMLEGANFWLDGHFSGDVTFQGEMISPIELELKHITKLITKGADVSVFIDDFRLFVEKRELGYPDPITLVNWAKLNNLNWTVEHDIFIAAKNLVN